jgi:hypothetical protein
MQRFAAVIVAALAVVSTAVPVGAGAATVRLAPGPVASAPTAIPSDCSRDVTAALLAWIASVPDGWTLSFTPDGCYRVDGTLTIQYRNGLTFAGNGATFRAFTSGRELPPPLARTRSMFNFWQGSNITIRDTIVRGANPSAGTGDFAYVAALEGQSAYVIGGVTNMVMDHVAAYDVYGDFVFVGPATKNLLVKNSTFSRNGRQGWAINGEDIVFENNTIRQTRRATIDIEPATLTSATRRVMIRNNIIGGGRLYFLANVGVAAPVEDISIIGNQFVGRAMTMRVDPPKGTRARFRVIGNVSDTAVGFGGGGALSFTNVDGVEVRDNVQPMQRGREISGVSIRGCRGVVVTGNTFLFGYRPVISRGGNLNVSQSSNFVSNPLRAVPASNLPGPY